VSSGCRILYGEVVARDRGGGYGQAVTRARPEMQQAADRWHLLENASAAFLGGMHPVSLSITHKPRRDG
jgi:hypothetical protein